MLHQYALVVAGHHYHLAHHPVEHALHSRIRTQGDADTIVERHLHILVHRMVVLAEAVHHGTFRRPRELADVGGELGVELGVHRLALSGRARLSLLHHAADFLLKGFLLLAFGLQLTLVAGFVFLEPGHQRFGFLLLAAEFVDFAKAGFSERRRVAAEPYGLSLLCFEFGLGLADSGGLRAHLAGETPEVAVAAEALPDVGRRQDVHVPEAAVAAAVGRPHQTGVSSREGVQPRLQGGDGVFLSGDVGIERGYLLFTFGHEGAAGADLFPGELEGGFRVLALLAGFGQLLVQNGDFLLELGALALLRGGLGHGGKRHGKQ